MATVNLSVSLMLIILAGVHIAEEAAKDFRGFFNTQWFNGNENCPVCRFKGLVVDKILLFLLLAGLALSGAWFDGRLTLVAVGIITADVLQHAIFSIRKRSYTPGVATSALYLLYVAYFFAQGEHWRLLNLDWGWIALAGGAAFIGLNYLAAWRKIQSGACNPISA